MLRRKSPDQSAPESSGFVTYPALDTPFVLGHAPAGVHFYGPKEAFYMPYAALQAMHLQDSSLTLIFANNEIVIHGRGLHSLYAQLADHKVKRVHEQGDRYSEVANSAVFIARIEHRSRITP